MLGLGEPGDPSRRAATRPGHARSLRRIRLLTGPLPLTTAALAERLSLSPDATCRLLDAAVSLGLAERRGRSVYGLGQLGAALAGNRAALSLIEHQPLLYADLQDPVALLRGSPRGMGIARYWPYSAAAHPTELAEEEVASYSALMAASQPLFAQEVLASYPIHRHRCLLDVGGGDGVFLAAAATRAPALRLMLFDLPAVAERARARLADAGLLERASIYGGDFLTMPRSSHFCGPCAERCRPMARSSSRRRCRASGAPNRWTPIMDSIPSPWAEASQEPSRKSADCCGK
jgi:hypothetical protein